jgi:cation diffusion facilitator CzcD-associated flavoprotein CzcO
LPYLPFPPHWPIFTPKDKLGDWFETYARSLELNVWMKTKITSTSWSDSARKWTVKLERTKKDGSTESRTLHPKHVIQATGHSGKKNFPSIKGMDNFKGHLLCHSSEFPGARSDSKGKNRKAIVVGCCNSGHDLSHSFYENGYDITMVQRSSTCVVSSASITEIALAGLYDESGPPTEDADTWLMGTPSSVLKLIQVKVTKLQGEKDKEILQGLEKAGFKLDQGPDGAGLFMKYFQRGGGYYIDVGASQLIVDGKIKIKQGQEITEVLPNGLRFADGSELEADEIIFATGYQNMRSQARLIFGDEVADRVGNIWGFDDEGEMRTIWRPSGHPGFWFMGGNLALCRYYSRLLALQIKAREEGLVK